MENKYTDEDVKRDPGLGVIARHYLLDYHGSFSFLVEAKRNLQNLNVATIRGVLNCMRSDSNVINLPEPKGKTFDASLLKDDEVIEQEEMQRIEEENLLVRLGTPVSLNVKWKRPYGVMNHIQASVIHTLDPTRSGLMYLPGATLDLGVTVEPDYKWGITWFCKPSYRVLRSPLLGRVVLLSKYQVKMTLQLGHLVRNPTQAPFNEPLMRNWRMCASCERRIENLSRSAQRGIS